MHVAVHPPPTHTHLLSASFSVAIRGSQGLLLEFSMMGSCVIHQQSSCFSIDHLFYQADDSVMVVVVIVYIYVHDMCGALYIHDCGGEAVAVVVTVAVAVAQGEILPRLLQ